MARKDPMRTRPTSCDGFFEVLNGSLLALEAIALLVMEPAKLLQYLRMVWVAVENPSVCGLGTIILCITNQHMFKVKVFRNTYIFLLLVDVADLEPDILLRQRRRRRGDNILEALQQVSYVSCISAPMAAYL